MKQDSLRDVFYSRKENQLPYFLKCYLIKKIQSDNTKQLSYDHFPLYGSEFSECSLPDKLISRIYVEDEE